MKPHTLGHTLVATLGCAAAFANPLLNADFEQSLAVGWSPKDVAPTNPLTVPVTLAPSRINTDPRPGSPGLWSLKLSQRDHHQDGMKQNILTNLAANGNGTTYTTRVWVKIDPAGADASVRCLLRQVDDGGARIPIILAESVIEISGVWVEITGTAKIEWAGSLTSAILDFEVEQIHRGNPTPAAPTSFPTCHIDDLTMEPDADGDGLSDNEESTDHAQLDISLADSADSDMDRIPDDFERAQIPPLDPRDASDADDDPDLDGFTHVQEYFAASNPRDANSYPGKPSDPQATFLTRALLRYLALRPWMQQSLIGQMVTDNATEYTDYVAALAAQPGGKWVAMLGLAVEKQNSPLDVHASIDHAITFANAGGIVQLKWAMWNPWRAHLYVNNQQIGLSGDQLNVDIPGLLDPAGTPSIASNTAQDNLDARAVMDGWIDAVALEIQRCNAATGGQPLLFRPLSEMNGPWFWWGHRTRAEYLGLWNHIRDRLIHVHGLHNLIWTCESASSEHVHPGPGATATASDYYYPGDDAVDVFGHNLYDGDWILPFDADKIYARHPKIYAVPQAGPDKIYPNRTGAFDNLIYRDQINARYPRISFFIVWNSFPGNLDDDNNPATPYANDDPITDTPDDTHQHLAIIDNQNAAELLADTRIITRDELAWQPATSATAAAASSTSLSVSWTPALNHPPLPAPTAYMVETSASNAPGSWSVAQTTPAGTSNAAVAGLTPLTSRWFRVRALYGGEDSLPGDAISAATWSLFQQWKHDSLGNFNAPDLADDDHDGLASLLEYGLGTHPLNASQSQQPFQAIIPAEGGNHLSLTFRRRPGESGVSYLVEATGDLVTGSWLPQPVQHGAAVDNGDGTETVTFRDTIPMDGAASRFLRLRVSSP
jgi:hypothetical protein